MDRAGFKYGMGREISDAGVNKQVMGRARIDRTSMQWACVDRARCEGGRIVDSQD